MPISSNVSKVYPFEVLIPAGTFGNKKACKAKADQIRTVDKRRLGDLLGELPAELLDPSVATALKLHLAIK